MTSSTPNNTSSFSRSTLLLLLSIIALLAVVAYYNLSENNKPQAEYEYWRNQGDSLLQNRQYAEALDAYQKALLQKQGDRYIMAQIERAQQQRQPQSYEYIAEGSADDEAFSIGLLPNGEGLVAVGSTHSYGKGNGDAWVVATDQNGQLQWRRTLGEASSDEQLKSVVSLADGDFLAVGTTTTGNITTGWLTRLDANGREKKRTMWTTDAALYDIIPYANEGFAAAGKYFNPQQGADFWLLQLDQQGDTIAQSSYGTPQIDAAQGIAHMASGDILLVGYTFFTEGADSTAVITNSTSDGYVQKIGRNGRKLSAAVYGGAGNDTFRKAIATTDGGAMVVGVTTSVGNGGEDVWVVKLNADCSKAWERAIGGTGNDGATDIAVMPDGAFLVAGYTHSYGKGDSDGWLLKIAPNGTLLWKRELGSSAKDILHAVVPTTDGRIAAAGTTWRRGNADFWLLQLDNEGKCDGCTP